MRKNQMGRLTFLLCYVFVEQKPVQAVITGGPLREVGQFQDITVDGSSSRDFARDPARYQKLIYTWACETKDIYNKYCSRDMPNKHAKQLTIPASGLNRSYNYTYTLRVDSTINLLSFDKTEQIISVVQGRPLYINIGCLRNCDQLLYSPKSYIHLRIECINCPISTRTYSVVNSLDTEISNTKHIVYTENSEIDVNLKATVTAVGRTGTAIIRLNPNPPPTGGQCTISPDSGVEYSTMFKISCLKYIDDHLPITYNYKIGDMTLESTANKIYKTRLYPSSGQTCNIEIDICDALKSCAHASLTVSLRNLTPSTTWANFLTEPDSNLKDALSDGDVRVAIVLIKTVISHMEKSEVPTIAEHIVNSLESYKINRLIVNEQILTIGCNLFEAIELNSTSANLVSKLFAIVTDGFLHCIQTNEVAELSLERLEYLIGRIASVISKLSSETDQLPMVHDLEHKQPDNPLAENYPDYGELDLEDVVKITDWLKSFHNIYQTLKVMGIMSKIIQLPHEPDVSTKFTDVKTHTVIIEKSDPSVITWEESGTYVEFKGIFMKNLPHTSMALQLAFFEKNPLWWVPEQYKINTEVISIGLYGSDASYLDSETNTAMFAYTMAFKDTLDTEPEMLVRGKVDDPLEMPIYMKKIPPNGVLLVTILSVEYSIRALLLFDEKPRSYMVNEEEEITAASGKVVLHVENSNFEMGNAYLAVISDTPTNFTFIWTIKQCLVWSREKGNWTSEYCIVEDALNSTHITCRCWHLSIFAARKHDTFNDLSDLVELAARLPVNYWLIIFYLVIIFFLALFLVIAYRRDKAMLDNLVVVDSIHSESASYKYIVTIVTNGHFDAGTTANITITLHGSQDDSANFTLYSNTSYVLFPRLSQVSFEFYTYSPLGTLKSISLTHDSFGRYPSWNCHLVKIRDVANLHEYVFMANGWLSNYKSSSCYAELELMNQTNLRNRRRIFRDTLTNLFANWYGLNVLHPTRLYSNFMALEKTAVFTVRCCVVLAIVLCFFGPSTLENYELEQELYYYMLLELDTLIPLIFLCYVVSLATSWTVLCFFSFLKPHEEPSKYKIIYGD